MDGALGCTSMTGFGSFGFSGFSLCTALFDIGELRRGNTEENPWLGVSVGLKIKIERLTGVHAATARRPPTLKFRIPIWKAAVMSAFERCGVVRLTVGPTKAFLGDISEVGSLVSANISTGR
jgi:hypothetical protein